MLDALKDINPITKDMKTIVEADFASDGMIDTLIAMLKDIRETIKDTMSQQKINKGINVLEKIKKLEEAEHLKDTADMASLEQMINEL